VQLPQRLWSPHQIGGCRLSLKRILRVEWESALPRLPERALLDSIDRPQFSGGLAEVSRIVAKAPARISWRVLLGYAKNWGESALVQRLGYLLDLHEVEVPASAALGYCRECAAGSAGRNACGAAGSEAICEEGQVIGKQAG